MMYIINLFIKPLDLVVYTMYCCKYIKCGFRLDVAAITMAKLISLIDCTFVYFLFPTQKDSSKRRMYSL